MYFMGVVPWSVGLLLTAFAASPKSGTNFARAEGAQLQSIFFACVTLARFVAVFISTRVKVRKNCLIGIHQTI